MKIKFVVGLAFLVNASVSNAALIMSIHEISNDVLSVSVSGTLDSESSSDTRNPGYLAFKADWSENIGTNVDWWKGSGTSNYDTFEETFTDGNIFTGVGFRNDEKDGDSVFLLTSRSGVNAIPDDLPFKGSFRIFGDNIFDWTGVTNLQVMSGWSGNTLDWFRLEDSISIQNEINRINDTTKPNVVNEPSRLAIFGLGLIALAFTRKRKIVNSL